jgi:hypothetical protein
MGWGQLEHQPNSYIIKPWIGLNFNNFLQAQLCHIQSDEAQFYILMSLRNNVVKKMNLLWFNGRDVHYPTDEPNPTHVQSSCWENAHLDFFKLVQMFGGNIVPPMTPHGMSEELIVMSYEWDRLRIHNKKTSKLTCFSPKYEVLQMEGESIANK